MEAVMKYIKRAGLDLLKGIAAAAASFIGLIAGGMVTSLLGLPPTGMPPQVDLSTIMPRMLFTLVVIAIVLGECFRKLYRPYWQRMLSIWLCNYILYYLLNTLDGMLFSPLPNMSTSIASNIFPSLFMALVVAWLWKPGAADSPDAGRVRGYFSARRPLDWAWRLAVAWLLYPPIYYLMGRVVGPFVQHYYEDPSLNLGLAMPPSMEVLLAMQVLRGALFLLAVLPIIFAWRGSKKGLWLWVGSVIFIQIAGLMIFQAYWLPAGLRIPHTLELLADSFLQAGVYALLLCFPMKAMESAVNSSKPAAGP
jgi:hypothetical protein